MLKTFSGRYASQNEEEFRGLLYLFQKEKVRSYCEIGAREGDTFYQVMRSLPERSSGVAVDLPGALWGKKKTRPQLEKAVFDLRRRGYEASCLFGDSRAVATRRLVHSRGPFDALLIDADHTLAGVTADWLAYQDAARLVVFHDIAGVGEKDQPTGKPVEVPMLWSSLRANGHKTLEFIAPGSVMGIGVLWTA